MATLLSIEGIHKTFEAGTVNENHVLKGLDLQVEEGDFISVIGGNGAEFSIGTGSYGAGSEPFREAG